MIFYVRLIPKTRWIDSSKI